MSLVAKRRIASHLIQLDVAPGDEIVRAGATGDRFYVIDTGDVAIDLGSRSINLGPGDFFGEIALLRDVRERRRCGPRALPGSTRSSAMTSLLQ
jgi:CRP-like cAMP-binding protein